MGREQTAVMQTGGATIVLMTVGPIDMTTGEPTGDWTIEGWTIGGATGDMMIGELIGGHLIGETIEEKTGETIGGETAMGRPIGSNEMRSGSGTRSWR